MKISGIGWTATQYAFLFYLIFQPIRSYSQDFYYLQERLEILEEKVFWLEQILSSQIDSLKKIHGQSGRNTTLSKKNEYSNNNTKYSSVKNFNQGNKAENLSSLHNNITEKSRTPSTEIATNIASMRNLIKARVFKKTWDSSESGGKMSILIAFTNATHQDIVAFKGDIILKDYFGNDITRFFIEIKKHIPSYSSKSWFGEVPYEYQNVKNDFSQLRTIKVEELMTILEPREILFSDGTRKIAK